MNILSFLPNRTNGEFEYRQAVDQGKKEFTFGRIDIRAVIPVGKGIGRPMDLVQHSPRKLARWGDRIMEYLGHERTALTACTWA